MGTRFGRVVLLLAVIGLALTSLAWAEKPAEDPAPVPTVVAQAPAPAEQAKASPADEATPAVAPAPQTEAVETQGVTKNAKGTVYYYDDRRLEVWVSIGSNQGLRPGAQVAFVRKGAVVANGTVKSVRSVDAIVTPDKDTPAGTILKGDDMHVVVNGTRKDMERQFKRERQLDLLLGVIGWMVMLLHG